jgi:hypothetical protein
MDSRETDMGTHVVEREPAIEPLGGHLDRSDPAHDTPEHGEPLELRLRYRTMRQCLVGVVAWQ